MLSVVIPYRNEEYLGFTVRRLHETINIPCEIITIDDGSEQPVNIPPGTTNIRFNQPIGAQFARHTGIERAKYETVLVIDAHMNFTDDDWAKKLVNYSQENPTHIGCTIMRGLAPGRMAMKDAVGRYYGAHIIPFEESQEDLSMHHVQTRRILVDKWNVTKTCGEVGCVLGGAYFLNRSWYLETLLAPWEELRGWGYLEANISIPNYLLGGKNVCLDIEVGHMFRQVTPFQTKVANILYNELLLAYVVIPDKKEREALIDRLQLPDDEITRDVFRMLDQSIAKWYRRYLVDKGQHTWTDYKAEWMNPDRVY